MKHPDVRSLAYTFGGHFTGDDPSDIDGWKNNPSLKGSFNREPKRVPKVCALSHLDGSWIE